MSDMRGVRRLLAASFKFRFVQRRKLCISALDAKAAAYYFDWRLIMPYCII